MGTYRDFWSSCNCKGSVKARVEGLLDFPQFLRCMTCCHAPHSEPPFSGAKGAKDLGVP